VASPPRKRWCFWNPNYPKILFFDTDFFTTLIVCWNVKQLWRSAEVLSISFQTPQRSAFDVLDVKTLRFTHRRISDRSSPWKYSMEVVPALRWRFLKTTSFIMTVWLFNICVKALSSVEGSLRLPKVSARRWGAPKLPSKSASPESHRALQKQALARRRWMITQFIPKEVWSIGLHQNDFELSSEKCGKPLGPRSLQWTSQSDGYFYTLYNPLMEISEVWLPFFTTPSVDQPSRFRWPPHHGIAAGAQFKVLDRKGPKTK